jgi:hypothetical protein
MQESSDKPSLESLFEQVPAGWGAKYAQAVLQHKVSVKKLDQKYMALCAEVHGAELLAVLLEYALAKFDRLAYFLLLFTSHNPNPLAMETNPIFRENLKDLIQQAMNFVQPTLNKLNESQAAEVRSELRIKLSAKEQGCLAIAEHRQATRGKYPDLETFTHEIAVSPMKSRAEWWAKPPMKADFSELLEQGRLAIERANKAFAAAIVPGSQQEDELQPNSETTWAEGLLDVSAMCDPEAAAPNSEASLQDSVNETAQRRGSHDRSKWKPEYRLIVEQYQAECQAAGAQVTIAAIFEAAGIPKKSGNGYKALRGERERTGSWLKIKHVCAVDKPHLKKNDHMVKT